MWVVADALTDREAEILSWIARGYTRAEVGAILWVSENTVKAHTTNIRRRLGVRSMTQAVAMWAAEEAERLLAGFYERGVAPETRRYWRNKRDMEVVIRDQRAHITNLEDQVLGMQRPEVRGEQGALI